MFVVVATHQGSKRKTSVSFLWQLLDKSGNITSELHHSVKACASITFELINLSLTLETETELLFRNRILISLTIVVIGVLVHKVWCCLRLSLLSLSQHLI